MAKKEYLFSLFVMGTLGGTFTSIPLYGSDDKYTLPKKPIPKKIREILNYTQNYLNRHLVNKREFYHTFYPEVSTEYTSSTPNLGKVRERGEPHSMSVPKVEEMGTQKGSPLREKEVVLKENTIVKPQLVPGGSPHISSPFTGTPHTSSPKQRERKLRLSREKLWHMFTGEAYPTQWKKESGKEKQPPPATTSVTHSPSPQRRVQVQERVVQQPISTLTGRVPSPVIPSSTPQPKANPRPPLSIPRVQVETISPPQKWERKNGFPQQGGITTYRNTPSTPSNSLSPRQTPPTPIRVSVEEVPSPSSPPQSSTISASPQQGSVNQPLSSSAGRKGAISSNTSIGRESTGRNSISHQLAQLIHQLNGNSQPPTEKITITSQKPKGRVSPSPISTLPTSPSGRPKKGGKNSSPTGVKPLILTKKGDRIVIIPYKASDLNPAERIHTQYLHRQVERKAKQETRKVTLTSQWKSIPGTSSSPKSPHSPMGTPKEVVNIPLISQGKGGATPKVAKVARIKITTSQIGSPPPGFTASSSSYKGGNKGEEKPIQPLSHPSQLSATNYNSTTSTSVTTPPPSPPLKSVAPVSPTLHFQAQYRSIYLDKPQPISLLEVAGKSFVVRENYTDNAPFLFQFGGDGIARVYYKNRPLVIQLVNGIIYVYDKSGRVLAYFQKVASDPVVGLVLIGHSLNRQGKVEQTWLDFWQYADYTPTKVDIRTLLPYRIFNSWTSQWYRQFWGNGIVDFYIYDPRYRSYRQYTNAPYSIIHGDLLVQDGSLLKMGNKLLQNSYTETISQIAQVGRYRIVAVTFSSFKEVQDPALFNKSWHDLIGKYWIDNWFRLLPNGQIEFVSGEEGRGYYRISGNVLEVTFVWNGKYLYSDRYLLDPTAGTIRNSFVTQFWDIVSPQPIVALTPSQQKLPTTNSNLLKKLYIDAYIHHLKRKHFF